MHVIVLNNEVRDQIKALVELAEACPVDMPTLMKRIDTADGKKQHMAQMTRQTIRIPMEYMVTFSIEHGHPCGTCRHLSLSGAGGLPPEEAVWVLAKELGFWGHLRQDCAAIWPEELLGHGIAINIVQTLTSEQTLRANER